MIWRRDAHVPLLWNLLVAAAGSIGTSVCMVSMVFMDCASAHLAVVILCLGFTFSGFGYIGHAVNMIDIAPKYAGSVSGLTNGIGSLSGLVAPYIVAAITTNVSMNAVYKACLEILSNGKSNNTQ